MEAVETLPVESPETEIPVIGRNLVVTGDIDTEMDLHVEGRIVGNVRCNTLILVEGGSVHGNISAERVLVSGMVSGSIETGDLAIESSAQVQGNVTYSRIRISNGGLIDGEFKPRSVCAGAVGAPPGRTARTARVKLIEAVFEGPPAEE